ncbi:MAG: hypothetical protein HOL70_10720 [Candidatus Marinimicrobia bacterium]|nr:hypothetical protein [Candidatus Neomarinimicrobiota bacterium]
MRIFTYKISYDQGIQKPDGDWDVINNETEAVLEDLTEDQQKALAALFASLVKQNKVKIDKTVEAIR